MSTPSEIRLAEVAHARSGDKGNHANIGVIAWTREGFTWLEQVLTVDRVAAWFAPLGATRVVRYPMPGIGAYNFVLENVLAGGASRSLRTDTQGKTLAAAILEMRLSAPPRLATMLRPPQAGGQETQGVQICRGNTDPG